MNTRSNEPTITSYAQAPTKTITAGGVTYAYRELGPKGGIPVVFFVHLAATLDNWDPRLIDPIAENRHVITFDQQGVGASTGKVPDTIEVAADDAFTFISAVGHTTIDVFAFSMGGMIAQDLVMAHPNSSVDSCSRELDRAEERIWTRSSRPPTGTSSVPP